MFPRDLSVRLLAFVVAACQGLLIEDSLEFPKGSEIENIVLRPSGSALATVYTFPHIYEVATAANSAPKLVHTFHNTQGVCGIAASSICDVYFAITGNFSFKSFSPTPGSYAIHQLRFGKRGKPIVTELASLKAIAQPNGIAVVPNTPYVLIADSRGGLIYRFDTKTLRTTIYFDHPLLKPVPTEFALFGVNGVKLSRGYLYFSNTNQKIVARIKASGKEQRLKGDIEIVARETPCDDFIVNDWNGDVYIAEQGSIDGIGFVSRHDYGSEPRTIAGGPGSRALLAPTAVMWAKEAVGRTLIVSVTGGFEQFVTQNYTGGGKLSVVHLE